MFFLVMLLGGRWWFFCEKGHGIWGMWWVIMWCKWGYCGHFTSTLKMEFSVTAMIESWWGPHDLTCDDILGYDMVSSCAKYRGFFLLWQWLVPFVAQWNNARCLPYKGMWRMTLEHFIFYFFYLKRILNFLFFISCREYIIYCG